MKVSLLISGGLGFDLLTKLHGKYPISFIATDSKSTKIVEFANSNYIPIFTGNPRNGRLYNFCKHLDNLALLSINYLFLIEEDVISLFKYPINFHGSLLPKYRGRTPHVWAIINNEESCGVTAHFIDNGCDTGDIILQESIAISPKDTGSSILEKYNQVYPILVEKILRQLINNQIQATKQPHHLATYYGKRTPEDGEINWGWHKERINNWVRAQSYPYPGAFTYINRVKLIVDEIDFSPIGFHNDTVNGTIIHEDPHIVIKTANGAVVLTEIRNSEVINLCLKDKILGNENK